MTLSFAFRKFAIVSAASLVLLACFPRVARAQEPQIAQKPASGSAPVSPTVPKPSEADKDSKSKDTAVLVREHVAMTSDRPKLVEKADVPNFSFTRELYWVEWRSKDPFDLYVIRPKGVAKPPVILYLPSFPDDTDQFKNNTWCDLAVRGGYAIVGFVGAVTGHRTRFRLMKEWFVSEMPEALTSTTHDVQLILDYLASRGDLDMDHVAMFGTGSGGAIAVLASAVDPRIKVLDLLAPWGDWKTWLAETQVIEEAERAKYTKQEFINQVSPLDPVKWLPRTQAKSLRIEDIRGNKAMPNKAQESLEAAAPEFAQINQYGNGRAFLALQAPITMLDWVKSQLQTDAKAQVALDKSARIHFYPALQPPATQNWPNVGPPLKAEKAEVAAKDKDKPKEKEKPQ